MGAQGQRGYDAIVVGARCAGATVAGRLADSGLDVLLLDHRPPPRNVVSTHQIFPNTVTRFAQMGVLERVESKGHTLNPVSYRASIGGYEIAGNWTPIDGFDYSLCIRRPVLDDALLDLAVDFGAETNFGEKVVGLLGSGTDEDPVRGVELEGGAQIEARWVIGADGRASSVAGKLGLEKTAPIAGEFSIIYAYWRGLPQHEFLGLEARRDAVLTWSPCEDDVVILNYSLAPDGARGDQATRERTYMEGLANFGDVYSEAELEAGERVSEILVAPETMLRGFMHEANGPGWALVGDANHFKHPATAQGISDAVEQALYVGDALAGGNDLSAFGGWRDERAAEFYEFSAQFATFPRPGPTDVIFGGVASDAEATQDFIDTMSRRKRPGEVFTGERMARWQEATTTT